MTIKVGLKANCFFSVEKSLNLALVNGIRAIRSHIDSFGENVMRDWDLLEDIRKKMARQNFLTICGFSPIRILANV